MLAQKEGGLYSAKKHADDMSALKPPTKLNWRAGEISRLKSLIQKRELNREQFAKGWPEEYRNTVKLVASLFTRSFDYARFLILLIEKFDTPGRALLKFKCYFDHMGIRRSKQNKLPAEKVALLKTLLEALPSKRSEMSDNERWNKVKSLY